MPARTDRAIRAEMMVFMTIPPSGERCGQHHCCRHRWEDESLDPINTAVVGGTVLEICPDAFAHREVASSSRPRACETDPYPGKRSVGRARHVPGVECGEVVSYASHSGAPSKVKTRRCSSHRQPHRMRRGCAAGRRAGQLAHGPPNRAKSSGHLRFRVGFRVDVVRCSCALKIPQSCRFRDSDCFVEGAMIAPSINDDVLLKEEQP